MSFTPKKRIGILASGKGSNFEAITKASQASPFPGEVVVLICDKKETPVRNYWPAGEDCKKIRTGKRWLW